VSLFISIHSSNKDSSPPPLPSLLPFHMLDLTMLGRLIFTYNEVGFRHASVILLIRLSHFNGTHIFSINSMYKGKALIYLHIVNHSSDLITIIDLTKTLYTVWADIHLL
jgi:hypothetical protein